MTAAMELVQLLPHALHVTVKIVSAMWIFLVFFAYANRVNTLAVARTGKAAYAASLFSFATCVLALLNVTVWA